MFRIASTWSAARQAGVLPASQRSACNSGFTRRVVQACELLTMPSATPSRWSQALSTAFETSCRSSLVKVLFANGTPKPEIRPAAPRQRGKLLRRRRWPIRPPW